MQAVAFFQGLDPVPDLGRRLEFEHLRRLAHFTPQAGHFPGRILGAGVVVRRPFGRPLLFLYVLMQVVKNVLRRFADGLRGDAVLFVETGLPFTPPTGLPMASAMERVTVSA